MPATSLLTEEVEGKKVMVVSDHEARRLAEEIVAALMRLHVKLLAKLGREGCSP